MNLKRIYLYLLPALVLLGACDLEKDIEVDLPAHEPQLVVECYLEPGKPMRALVLESASYFDDPVLDSLPQAEVYITFGNKRVKLDYKPMRNKTTGRYYTHTSHEIMKGKLGDVYSLEVSDASGRKVTGFTTVVPIVPIEDVEWKFNDKDKAYLLTSFQDNANTANYYRYMTHLDSLNTDAERDLLTNDELTNGKRTSYGSAYDYEEGDTMIVTLYNIEKQYYDFMRSVSDAKDANGNPFAQPSRIKSSVFGGIGIFTNLAYDRRTVILTR